MPRTVILDPQGKAIRDALGRLGFEGVADVRAGKSFEISLAAADREEAEKKVREMSARLLANPVVEDFEVEVLSDAEVTA